MKLSVCVCAMHSRNWMPICRKLHEMCRKSGQAELLVSADNGAMTSGQKRNILTAQATGDYIAFVDDDDNVSNHYLETLIAAMTPQPDVITFRLDMQIDREPHQIQQFSVHYRDREKLQGGIIGMTANHLCAWKLDVARRVSWAPDLGYGDDQLWYKALMLAYPDVREQRLDETLYFYRHSRSESANQQSDRVRAAKERYAGGVPVYRGDQGAYVATEGWAQIAAAGANVARVRNWNGQTMMVNHSAFGHSDRAQYVGNAVIV